MNRAPTELRHELEGHPAVEAWRRMCPGAPLPSSIEALKTRRGHIGRHKSYIYRLHGAGDEGGSIVAKLCRNGTAALEISVYRDLLPSLGVATLRLFGTLEEKRHEMTWLFTEDAGEERFSPNDEVHLRLASAWLGEVHAGATSLQELDRLPSHGSERYLEHLSSARSQLEAAVENGSWSSEHAALLNRLLPQLAQLDADWPEIEGLSMERELSPTLVHGDLVSKNVRVRPAGSGTALLALDWETAGRGLPAPDLAEVPIHGSSDCLDSYLARVRSVWPELTAESVRRLACVGRVFRLVASIDWAAYSLSWRLDYPARPMGYLQKYTERLDDALDALMSRS